MMRFIDIIDRNGRTSALLVNGKVLTVIGVLRHNTDIRPKTKKDALKLLKWAQAQMDTFSDTKGD